jgi:glycosyltransferase involved in cell wall biosynthesis
MDNIYCINTEDNFGGASKVAYLLYQNSKKEYKARLLVKNKYTDDKNIYQMDDALYSALYQLKGRHSLSSKVREKLSLKKGEKCLFHFHNLHGDYFPLSCIPALTNTVSAIWTLHDMWAFTGHCVHSFKCERWIGNCYQCEHLDYHYPIEKDVCSARMEGRKEIYDRAKIIIAVPSQWLKNKVEKSLLKNKDIRLVYNGVDENIFKPRDKELVRKELSLPRNKRIVLYTANGGIESIYRCRSEWAEIFNKAENGVLFINIGTTDKVIKEETRGKAQIVNVPFIREESTMAKYYAASDVYLFPSLADNCPLSVLEAMSSGLAVVTFKTGGIPELVQHMKNGYIAEAGNITDLVNGLNNLIRNNEFRLAAGISARSRVLSNFTLNQMLAKYGEIYKEALSL